MEKEYKKAIKELVDICKQRECKTREDVSECLYDNEYFISLEAMAIVTGYLVAFEGASSLEEVEDMLDDEILKELNKTI